MSRHGTKRSRGRRIGTLVVVLIVLAGFAFGAYFAVQALRDALDDGDYDGSDTGSTPITFVVRDGESGTTIAENLVDQEIIKSYKGFLKTYNEISPEPVFHPGAYTLYTHMSAADAIAVLGDEANRIDIKVTIPEGYRLTQILSLISDKADIPLEKLQAAAVDVDSYDVPQKAKDNKTLEGFLFPATYTIDPEQTPEEIITMLVDRANQALDEHGVEGDDLRYEVMTKAALVQTEAGRVELMGKVARVFQNRLDQGMKLESDASVSYGTGRTDSVFPSQAEINDTSNPYNTRANAGLPIGPISNPGDDAIAAVLDPTPGDWLFFVTVNLETGETVFSTTYAEHQAAVAQMNEWLAAHPEYNQ